MFEKESQNPGLGIIGFIFNIPLNLEMDSQNIILPPSLRSEDVNEIKNTFIVFAGSEDGILIHRVFYV